MPQHIDVAFLVSCNRPAAVQVCGVRDQVPFAFEALASVLHARVKHSSDFFIADLRFLGSSATHPADVYPSSFSQSQLRASHGADRNRSSRLAVHLDSRREFFLPWPFRCVKNISPFWITFEEEQVDRTIGSRSHLWLNSTLGNPLQAYFRSSESQAAYDRSQQRYPCSNQAIVNHVFSLATNLRERSRFLAELYSSFMLQKSKEVLLLLL